MATKIQNPKKYKFCVNHFRDDDFKADGPGACHPACAGSNA